MKWVWVTFFPLFFACSQKPPPEHHYHPATIVNDIFPVEGGMPVREVKKNQEFFFKKCELKYSHPFFTRDEYQCTDIP